MTGRAYMGEVLIQVWLKSIKKNFGGSRKLLKAHKRVCDENERNKEKTRCTCKSVTDRRRVCVEK